MEFSSLPRDDATIRSPPSIRMARTMRIPLSDFCSARPAAPDLRCKDAAAAYADDCFGESKIVRTGLAWPMPAHDLASNLNSARAQVGMWTIPLSKR